MRSTASLCLPLWFSGAPWVLPPMPLSMPLPVLPLVDQKVLGHQRNRWAAYELGRNVG